MPKLQKKNFIKNRIFLSVFYKRVSLLNLSSLKAWPSEELGVGKVTAVNISFTRKNIFVCISQNQKVLFYLSSGLLGFKGSQKKILGTSNLMSDKVLSFLVRLDCHFFFIKFIGSCAWKQLFLKNLLSALSYHFKSDHRYSKMFFSRPIGVFYLETPKIPFNGCRLRKLRRA